MKEKRYEPRAIESFWYGRWEQENFFTPRGVGNPYCIVIPPPNVTGTLHMGHGFQTSLMDALIRYHRMLGCNTLWQLGTDHAGIATQLLVENTLHNEGKTRQDLGREEFLKRVWQWKQASGSTITQQQRRLGVSGDWQRERFTLDPELVHAVHTAFIRLYEEGLIYRGKRLINWDPVLKTALSDLEVINEETAGHLWYIAYPLVGREEQITVATTRPETILGDTAVAVHPQDLRYQHLIGQAVCLPLSNRQIPIIADESVDPTFGSGCVKITPAHDFNDYQLGKRHDLPCINIFTPEAVLNENVPLAYRNLDRFVARKRVLADLTQLGLLLKTEEHTLKVPKGDRSGAIVEPYLTDQWFVKMPELAQPAIQALRDQKIKFVPEHWGKIYLQWLENIEDWCISRQLWWGHRIPAWYDAEGNCYVGVSEAAVREKFRLGEVPLRQDEDVLDTWFSSALWPFATLGWPQDTAELQTFYPTSVLVTGFDIIFFWVARMVMFGLKFTGQVPFRDIYITGLVRDSAGQKMSKSKGNILDPLDLADGISLEQLIAKRTAHLMQENLRDKIIRQTKREFPAGIEGFGVDALRYTFCSLATTGQDINFDLQRLEGYRNFCTKLWNGSRFILMQLEGFDANLPAEYTAADYWIQGELNELIRVVTKEFANYRFDLVTQAIYEFTWYQFCDWYLELTKPVLNASEFSTAIKQGTKKTLLEVLEKLLRIIHPFMPFITEELWQALRPILGLTGKSIMLEPYPVGTELATDAGADIPWLKNVVLAIRSIRSEIGVPPTKVLALFLAKGSERDRELVMRYTSYLQWLAKIGTIHWVTDLQQLPLSASATIEQLELYLAIPDLDWATEIARLSKEISVLTQLISALATKLENSAYVTKAPALVIQKDRTTLAEKQELLLKLQQKLSKIKDYSQS